MLALSLPQDSPDSFVLVTATRFLSETSGKENFAGEKTSYLEPYACVENQYLGWMIITNREGYSIHCTPTASQAATFFRSSAKPFQAFPLLELKSRIHLTDQELAIACSSHSGSMIHLEWVNHLLHKAGLTEKYLQCGSHMPLDSDMKAILKQSEQPPSVLYNNCSGKHAGMLLYCQQNGLDVHSYLNPEHPLQRKILDVLKEWSGVDEIPVAIDGCGAPVFYLPLLAMARLYAHLGTSKEFKLIRDSMTAYPELIGGLGRLDTCIMQASKGKILVKCGADGVVCASKIANDQGLALKIASGTTEVRDMALVEILKRLGWLTASEMNDPCLLPFRELRKRLNTQGKMIGDFRVQLAGI